MIWLTGCGFALQLARRAARLGDVWYPIGNNPRFPVGTPSDYLEAVTRLRRSAEAVGRDPSMIGLTYSASWLNDHEAHMLPNGERRLLTGVPDQVAGDIKAFADVGVRHFMFNFQRDTLEETLARMERFATTVTDLGSKVEPARRCHTTHDRRP